MYETHVTVQGRLVADPVVKHTQGGVPFAVFRVAQSERRPVPGEPGRWADSEPSFYDVTAFRGLGTNAGRSLRKGHPVVVVGRLRIRGFTRQDGSTGSSAEVDALALGHDLRWGSTVYSRGDSAGGTGDPTAAPEVRAALDAQAGRGGAGDGLGDPETVDYVVADDGPGGGADSGPLVRPDGGAERAA